MSRKKPKIVDYVEHPDSGIKVPIKMNQDTLTFTAILPDGEQRQNADGSELKREVYQWLDNNLTLEWHSVIQVEMLTPFARQDDHFVGFEINRFHWARKIGKDGGFVKCLWLHRPDDPYTGPGPRDKEKCGFTYVDQFHPGNKFDPPCYKKGHTSYYYIPYSDETWAGLKQMLQAIKELRSRLSNILTDPNGHAYLAIIGANILKALPGDLND